jgi:Fe2+ transport system protein FeoA
MVKASCIQDSSALVGGHGAPVPLSRADIGRAFTILGIDGAGRAELEREGMLPGRRLLVVARTPLGGPVVVQLGRARLALSAEVARQVTVTVISPDGEEPA